MYWEPVVLLTILYHPVILLCCNSHLTNLLRFYTCFMIREFNRCVAISITVPVNEGTA